MATKKGNTGPYELGSTRGRKKASTGSGRVGTQKTYKAKSTGPAKFKTSSTSTPSKKVAKGKAAAQSIKSKTGGKAMTKSGMKRKNVTGKELRQAKRIGAVAQGSSPTTKGYKYKKGGATKKKMQAGGTVMKAPAVPKKALKKADKMSKKTSKASMKALKKAGWGKVKSKKK